MSSYVLQSVCRLFVKALVLSRVRPKGLHGVRIELQSYIRIIQYNECLYLEFMSWSPAETNSELLLCLRRCASKGLILKQVGDLFARAKLKVEPLT